MLPPAVSSQISLPFGLHSCQGGSDIVADRYYYAQCFNNGQGAGRSLTCKGSQCRGRNPTSIENVRSTLFFGV